ncbi:MAG: hypothetical protein WDZ49_15775 [Litorilinea sp.]
MPDYTASNWLRFRRCGHLPCDPNSTAQFDSALNYLSALTIYFCEVSGPWCAVTPQEVRELHCDYNIWCRYTPTDAPVPITLHHLRALSMRHLFALGEFGGTQREEYSMFRHLHDVIVIAARGTRRSVFAKPKPWQFEKLPKPANVSWRGKGGDAVPLPM